MNASARSRLPFVSLLVAVDSIALPFVGSMLVRLDVVPSVFGFFIALAGVLPAAAAVLLAGWSLRRDGHSAPAMTALFLGAGFVLAVIALVVRSSGVPRMNDITTDLEDPVTLVASDGTDIPYPVRFVPLQRDGYPDLTSARFDAAPEIVWQAAVEIARARGWELDGLSAEEGRIVAVVTTPFFRFKDDVVIRVRMDESGSLVDVRSRSRVGRSDLGANARRILDFLANLQDRLD